MNQIHPPEFNPLFGFLPMLVFSIPLCITAYLLAKQKGRNEILWAVLGFLPFINMFAMWYIIGASNLILDKKIEMILKKLEENDKKI